MWQVFAVHGAQAVSMESAVKKYERSIAESIRSSVVRYWGRYGKVSELKYEDNRRVRSFSLTFDDCKYTVTTVEEEA